MATKMSDDERRTFLSEGTRTGHLATVRADGRPHVAPVWFVLDGDDLIFTTHTDTAKGRAIQRDPRVTISVDRPEPLYDFVIVEGTATISEDPDELLRWATMIAARYMGEEKAEAYGKRNGVPGELLIRITPTKIVAQKDISA